MSKVQNKSVKDVSRLLFHESQQKHTFWPQNVAKAEQLQFTKKLLAQIYLDISNSCPAPFHFCHETQPRPYFFFLLNESDCEETVWAKLAGNAVFILSK